jgi:hypothetical protein
MVVMGALQFLLLVTTAQEPRVMEEKPFCACVEMQSSLDAIGRLSRADWTSVDHDALTAVWPGAVPLPCEENSRDGIAAVTASMERCCNTCGTCGGPFLDELNPSELRSILISACRESSIQLETEMKQLVRAAVPADVTAVYEQGWSLLDAKDESLSNGYRWHAGTNIFALRVLMGQFEGQWYGSFELRRCDLVSGLDHWVLDDGDSFEILESEVKETVAGRRELSFSYSSYCVEQDYRCLHSEWQRLWPRLRSVAVRNDVDTIFLSAEGCGGGTTVFPKRDSNGVWELPW